MKPILSTALLLGLLAGTAQGAVLHTEKSLYRNIVVYEEAGLRCMRFGRYSGSRQSCQNLADPQQLVFEYARMMMGALYLNPAPQRVLIIGLGGGTLPSALTQLYPGLQLDVVEIDPAVVKVARKYFGFTPSASVRIHEMDGRVFVIRALKQATRYDLVMLDAFDHEYIPEHLLTREFLGEVRDLMTANGVLAANTFSSSRLYKYESATYQAVFGDFFNLKDSNRVILLRKGGLPNNDVIKQNVTALSARLQPLLRDSTFVTSRMVINKDWPTETRVLTDQYSPANLLNSR